MRLVIFATALLISTPLYAQRIDRLERLADHIEKNVPDKKFDYKQFGNTTNPDDPGYLGCLAGHGTTIFKSEGLVLKPQGMVVYYGYADFHALAQFFEISSIEALDIFNSHKCMERDRKFAVAHLRKFIKAKRQQQMLASTF